MTMRCGFPASWIVLAHWADQVDPRAFLAARVDPARGRDASNSYRVLP